LAARPARDEAPVAFSEVDQLFCSCHGVERLMLDGGKEEAEPFVDFALLPDALQAAMYSSRRSSKYGLT